VTGVEASRWRLGSCRPVTLQSGDSSKLKFHVGQESMQLAQAKGPLALFEALVERGQLQDDPEQRRVLEILTAIYYGAPKRTARGLYLHGSVGCGKSMSMDIFFTSLQEHCGLRVERKHFHEFLYDVQRLLHEIKRADEKGVATGKGVERAGAQIAAKVDVLCFDEFAVTTIQDCCILLPLFNALFTRGVTVIATSNRAPEDLYTDGLNRQVYLPPFLELLHANCKVHHMQSTTDYRSVHYQNSPDAGVFCWPTDRSFLDSWFEKVAGHPGGAPGQTEVAYGRALKVPEISSCGQVARFNFADLCEEHLAADDYNAICTRFHTILLDSVPCLTVDQHNEARRLTLLIDCCYEHHTRLISSMAGPPEEILGNLAELKDVGLREVGKGMVGCGDGDSAASSSGVLGAISRIKSSLEDRRQARTSGNSALGQLAAEEAQGTVFDNLDTHGVLASEIERARSHGEKDISIWRQSGDSSDALTPQSPPQVSKGWDDRRRISSFTWESTDPTSEQQSIKGVFAAAVASLQESGFAVDRAISRLKEMQTVAFQEAHREKHGLA